MGETILGNDMYNKLSQKTWVLQKIEKHHLHGSGPIFAYYLEIKHRFSLSCPYWIFICNELSVSGPSCQITSNRQRQYSCNLRSVRAIAIYGNEGHISIENVLLDDNSRRNFTIRITFPDNGSRETFNEMISFFGY